MKWSEGLHQAIEAKEGLAPSPEMRTLATISLQEYFKLYKKLAGMTGTAITEAAEFREAYKVDVAVVPTRRPVNRVDFPDRLFATAQAKHDAIVKEIGHHSHGLRRPVLVGTTGIEASERLSGMLTKHGIKHQILDARPANAAREAEVIGKAGERVPPDDTGAVTIATHMAGRGTDIRLGADVIWHNCYVPTGERLRALDVEADELFPSGSVKCCIYCTEYDQATNCAHCFKPQIDKAFPCRGRSACRDEPPCGLHVIGTERSESRRADNQLRSRSGRQGDPGSSRFFMSLEDGLLAGMADKIRAVAGEVPPEGIEIGSPRLSRLIEGVQRKAEEHDRDIRRACGSIPRLS
jgi:preprotein translocase subunit SecA